jgi:hypothetical protein
MKNLIYILQVVLIILSSGCQNESDKYVGKWIETKNESQGLEIEKNGNNFIVHIPNSFRGNIENRPAKLESGMLKIDNGFGGVNLAIQESSGLLTDGQHEYKKTGQ